MDAIGRSNQRDEAAAVTVAEGEECAHLLEALISDDERDFFKQFFQLLSIGGSIQSYQSKLARMLVQRPYPTLQIVQQRREQSKFYIGRALVEALQLLLSEIEKSKLHLAAEGSSSSSDVMPQISPRFINFLANFPITVLDAVSLRCKLLKILTAAAPRSENDHIYTALLSRPELELLEELLAELSSKQWQCCAESGAPSAEFVLFQALRTQRRQHFVPLVSAQLQDFRSIRSVAVRNNLLILKLANEFSNMSATVESVGGDIGNWLDSFALDESPLDLQEVHKFFYADFQRLAAILSFLRQYPEAFKNIKVSTLLYASGMLELLYEYNINASLEESRRIIESIHWQPQTAATKCRRNLELETLTYYGALSAVYDMVLSETNVNLGPYYSTKVLQLNTRLRQVRNVDVLCSLIEDIFQLVFLRWEHVRRGSEDATTEYSLPNKKQKSRYDGHTSSTSTDNEDAAVPKPAALPTARVATDDSRPRHGFICPQQALRTLFTFLKQFVTKKLHSEDYKHASERIQLRFQRIVDIIGEALWKHSVLEKIDESSSLANATNGSGRHCHMLAAEELLQLVLMHQDPLAKSSSDDDVESAANRDRCNYTSLTRRKSAKKRRRATIGGAVVTRVQGRNHAQHITTASVDAVSSSEHRVLQAALKARHLAGGFADQRSFIPSMLGSPENLAIMALALKNFNDVKYIIETFNLQNTELNRELAFVEQQQQVKQKLASIFTNYQQQEERSRRTAKSEEPRATVEQIKSVAAKGFEVSKIISVIDNFAQAQHVQQTEEIKHLLQPHHTQGSTVGGVVGCGSNHLLRQFEERNLNAVIICDLILNLPFNREITTNVLMVIKRQQQISPGGATTAADFKAASASSTGGGNAANASHTTTRNRRELTKEMGAMSLLENLCECMRLTEDRKSLRGLLCDSYYTLRPRKLAVELQRERAFEAVFYKTRTEFASCTDLKRHATLFQNLLRSGANANAGAKCNYYARFSAYMTHLSKLLQLRNERGVGTSEHQSTTRLLKTDACAIIGELIFECQLTPLEIEANVAAMNLNLVHVIALNICPAIAAGSGAGSKASSAAAVAEARSKISPQKQQTIHNYISNQNRLLAFLLQSISQSKNSNNSINATTTSIFELGQDEDMNSVFLQRYLQLPEISQLASLYGDQRFIAALRSDTLNMELIQHLDSKHQQLEIFMLQMGNQELKRRQVEEIDRIIVGLIQEDPKNVYLTEHMHDVALRAKLLQANFTKIATTRLAKELIETTLRHKEALARIPHAMRAQLEALLADITIYAKVSEVLQFETWPQAYDFGLKTPNAIFERLLQLHLYKLCYKWCCVVKLTQRFAQHKRAFLTALLQALLEINDADQVELNLYLLQILKTFELEDCVQFLDANKDKFRSVLLLQYVIEFLAKNTSSPSKITGESQNYKNYRISLVIFEQLTYVEREPFWKLIKFPLLIIEQLIMNAKFEILTKVMIAVRKALQQPPTSPLDLQLDNSEVGKLCPFCFDKRGHIYDIHTKSSTSNTSHKVRFQLGGNDSSPNHANSAFILLNFNLYQKDHHITNDCIDLLMRIYATKALDYHISDSSSVASSSAEHVSQTTDMQQSLDSLCGAFEMPRVPPGRDEWVRDEEATHCMCCHRAAFTMLMRRHHCRRCGRVVCFACSAQRMRIPELYADVEVRICNDCLRHCDEASAMQRKSVESGVDNVAARPDSRRSGRRLRENDLFKWKLSGNITHDKLVREEFCYEHAPSVALCLSILDYHLGQQKCIDLLLYHCRKLEKLIVPNPEVDYELVAKMMNCLALAAKVRGGPAEVENIREHSEIIMSVVQNGCDALIPNNHSLRILADSLVQAEKWKLALEVHLKCGFPTTGVMAAHGLACLRAGCFDTAREKFSHCMPKLSNEMTNSKIYKCINSSSACSNIATTDSNDNPTQTADVLMPVKRPQRGPPLLQEILRIVETFPPAKPQPETLHRASIIRNSNTSLASLLSRRKDPFAVPMSEPALNVLTTLANLKRVAKGHYAVTEPSSIDRLLLDNRQQQQQQQLLRQTTTKTTRGFEECIYYLLTYGSHTDILQFLMRHQELPVALRYFMAQCSDADLFIQHIYLVALRCGQVPPLIDNILASDGGATRSLSTWRQTLLQTCRYLETQNLMNSLYQLQVLLKDPVRASMTCVKFYSMNCTDFQQLHANAEHLHNAHMHLQSELELAQWENIQPESTTTKTSTTAKTTTRSRKISSNSIRRSSGTTTSKATAGIFLMQMDARSLNSHINTILKQLDVAKFLAKCEKENMLADGQTTAKILKQIRNESLKTTLPTLPTLFDTAQEKILVCILILLCGKNIEEGFGLTYRIIQDYKLPPLKVFTATAKFLARNQRLADVEKLLNCITSSNGINSRDIDEILSIAINSADNSYDTEVKMTLDNLAKKIHSIELRISCHIFIGQLKSAYLLANKYERLSDIRKILRQAELTNQIHIKKLCEKKLQMHTSLTSVTEAL